MIRITACGWLFLSLSRFPRPLQQYKGISCISAVIGATGSEGGVYEVLWCWLEWFSRISISNNGTYRPGTPCSLLKELQRIEYECVSMLFIAYFQQQFNLTRYTLNLEVNGKYPCGRMARTDRLGPYIDLYDYYHEPGSDDSLPMKGPFKRIQFMGHFINIPSNWRELLQVLAFNW